MTHARIPDFSQPAPVRQPQPGATGRRLPTDRRYLNLPNEAQPGSLEPWEAVAPVRPDTAHTRALRFLNVGAEALTAVAIIAGGVFAYLEEIGHAAFDIGQQVIAALDRIDGDGDVDTDFEPDADAEPSLAASENAEDGQFGLMLGGDQDREGEAAEVQAQHLPLNWRGAGNVVSAAGCAVLAIVAGRA